MLALDSSVVVDLLLQRRGWQAVHRALTRRDVLGVLPGPVLTESIQVARRRGNTSTGVEIHDALSALGLRVAHPNEVDLVRAAELLEISNARPGPSSATLSLGDALILAICEGLDCVVLTRDHYWRWLLDEGLVQARVVIP